MAITVDAKVAGASGQSLSIRTTGYNELIVIGFASYSMSPPTVSVSGAGTGSATYVCGSSAVHTGSSPCAYIYTYVASTPGTYTISEPNYGYFCAVALSGVNLSSPLYTTQTSVAENGNNVTTPANMPVPEGGYIFAIYSDDEGNSYSLANTTNWAGLNNFGYGITGLGLGSAADSANTTFGANEVVYVSCYDSFEGTYWSSFACACMSLVSFNPLVAYTPPPVYPPSAPSWLTYPAAGNYALGDQIAFAWSAASPGSAGDSITYTLQSSADIGSTWSNIVTGLTGTSYTWAAAGVTNSNLEFRVVAVESNGQSTPSATKNTITLVADPSAPTVPPADVPSFLSLSGPNVLSWDAVTPTAAGETVTYTLQYAVHGTNVWTTIASGVLATSYTWSPSPALTFGRLYDVQIFAVQDGGTSSASLICNGTVAGVPPSAPPTFDVSSLSPTDIYFSWAGATAYNNDLLNYTLSYMTSGGNAWTKIADGITGTSYSWTNFSLPEGDYSFKVDAVDVVTGISDTSGTEATNIEVAGGATMAIRGATGVTLANVLMVAQALPTSVPHVTAYTGLCKDAVTGEIVLFVATHFSSDNSQVVDFTNPDGFLAFDTFHLPGRPLIRNYGGVSA